MARGTMYLIMLILVVTACSNGSTTTEPSTTVATEPPTTDAPATTTTPPTSTTTTTVAASPDTTVNVPDPANTTEDHLRNMREIQAFLEFLGEEHPDPSLVDLVIDPECSCYQFWTETFGELAENEWRYDSSVTSTIVDVLVFNTVDDVVELGVTITTPEDRILDSEGSVVETFPSADARTTSMLLRKGSEGRWRILQVTSVDL